MSADASDEFIAAATRMFETARPWIAAGLAEHAAHPDGAPGACRLCALNGAVAKHIEPFAAEASRSFGQFADEVLADLLKLAEELLGSARIAFAAVAADYSSTVTGSTDGAEAATDQDVPTPASQGQSSQTAGYERIDIQLSDEPSEPTQ